MNTVSDTLQLSALNIFETLNTLDVNVLKVSPYTKKYLADYIPRLEFSLDAIALTLQAGIAQTGKKPEEVVLIESGGGVGIMSVMAKLSGVKEVIYNDIFDLSCKDFPAIASLFDLKFGHIVHGDSSQLAGYCKAYDLPADLVVSRNVIEHIYNIPDYLNDLRRINSTLSYSFSTTANNANPAVRIYTRRIHKKVELKGTGTLWANREMDSNAPYLVLRRQLIQKYKPTISEGELDLLAAQSRGLAAQDLYDFVDTYLRTGEAKSGVESTNTCDPVTGNWAENLLSYNSLRDMFNSSGFSLTILPGFWNTHYKKWYLRPLARMLNRLMKWFPSKALTLSPFIILSGKSRSSS